jgi:hypothetical protein
MENKMTFLPAEELPRHTCTARREGEWLVFTCPHCSYIRRFNTVTGDREVVQGEDPGVMHDGQYQPVGVDWSTLNGN